jgi:alpha-L-rhamnosidase
MTTPPSPWLYVPGDREAHIMARMRRTSFRDCSQVFHPGLYRRPTALAQFRLRCSGPARRISVRVAWSGELQLQIAGRVALRGWRDTAQALRVSVNLPAGDCEIRAIVTREDAPPALQITADTIGTALPAWEASVDMVGWQPAVRAAAGDGYPHDYRLPERTVRLRCGTDGLWGCDRLLCGPVGLSVSGSGSVLAVPGETRAEALSDAAPEQPPLRAAVHGKANLIGRPMAVRHLRVMTSPGVVVRSVAVQEQSRFLPLRASFACSDPLLEAVWRSCAETVGLCARELFVDGIKRDRLPWAGDLWVGVRAEAATTGDGAAARDTLVALAPPDARRRHVNTIIDYTALWLIACAEWRQRYGEDGLARELQPEIADALAALAAASDADGFLRTQPGDWLFIDWVQIDKRGVCTALQALYHAALLAGADLLQAAGIEPALWRQRARTLRSVIWSRLWDGKTARFFEGLVDGRPGGTNPRHANLLMLALGLAGGARRSGAVRALLDPSCPPAGTPYMRWVEATALLAGGRASHAVAGIREHWSGMLTDPHPTTWEARDPTQTGDDRWAFYQRPFAKSLCHVWGAGPAAFLGEDLPGVAPTSPGWATLRWRPGRLPLTWLRSRVPTPHGLVEVEQEVGIARLRVPAGITVDLPRGAVVAGRRRWELRK